MIHADQAILAKPPETEAEPDDEPDDAVATAWTADDRSLTLFAESRGGARYGESSFPGAQRQSPVRRFAQVLGVLLIAAAVVFGISYW